MKKSKSKYEQLDCEQSVFVPEILCATGNVEIVQMRREWGEAGKSVLLSLRALARIIAFVFSRRMLGKEKDCSQSTNTKRFTKF